MSSTSVSAPTEATAPTRPAADSAGIDLLAAAVIVLAIAAAVAGVSR